MRYNCFSTFVVHFELKNINEQPPRYASPLVETPEYSKLIIMRAQKAGSHYPHVVFCWFHSTASRSYVACRLVLQLFMPGYQHGGEDR